jgi:hypothetical protein
MNQSAKTHGENMITASKMGGINFAIGKAGRNIESMGGAEMLPTRTMLQRRGCLSFGHFIAGLLSGD